jgi:hypothetical protein
MSNGLLSEPSIQSSTLFFSRLNNSGIHRPLRHRYSSSLHSLISSCQQCSSSNPPLRQSIFPSQISPQSKHAGYVPRLHSKCIEQGKRIHDMNVQRFHLQIIDQNMKF